MNRIDENPVDRREKDGLMLKILRTMVVALSLIVAGAMPAAAQQAAPAPVPVQQQSSFPLTLEEVGAIAIGAVAGSLALRVLVGGMGHLTGAVLGGIAGYWYYTQPAAAAVPKAG